LHDNIRRHVIAGFDLLEVFSFPTHFQRDHISPWAFEIHRSLVVTDRFEGRRNRHWLGEVEVDRGRTTGASFAISNTTVVLLDGQHNGSVAA
jgi:hypothetical protein